MNYQIADAKMRYFNDKQHYLNFLKAWKKAATKSVNKGEDWACLSGAHMLLYALLRGKDVRTAFTPITKKTKLTNGALINHGMYWAYTTLISLKQSYPEGIRDRFLAPFNGTIDDEVLLKIIDEMPKITPLYSNYGPGTKVAEQLIENRNSSKVLWELIDKIIEEIKTAPKPQPIVVEETKVEPTKTIGMLQRSKELIAGLRSW